jgi:hypothetical protein
MNGEKDKVEDQDENENQNEEKTEEAPVTQSSTVVIDDDED